jgi:pyruvoyl-dependent arginine decarboxylase (PvlArgDC)
MESETRISKSFVITFIVVLILAAALGYAIQKNPANFNMSSNFQDDQTELVAEEMVESQLEINTLTEVSPSSEISDIEADLNFDFDQATRLDDTN